MQNTVEVKTDHFGDGYHQTGLDISGENMKSTSHISHNCLVYYLVDILAYQPQSTHQITFSSSIVR